MVVPTVIPIDEISNDQLEKLNATFNGNLLMLTSKELSIWKSNLIKEGYIWNDLDGWGFWSLSNSNDKKKKKNMNTSNILAAPIIQFRRPNRISSIQINYTLADML